MLRFLSGVYQRIQCWSMEEVMDIPLQDINGWQCIPMMELFNIALVLGYCLYYKFVICEMVPIIFVPCLILSTYCFHTKVWLQHIYDGEHGGVGVTLRKATHRQATLIAKIWIGWWNYYTVPWWSCYCMIRRTSSM